MSSETTSCLTENQNKEKEFFLKENVRNFYAIISGHRTFFSIIEFVFRGKRGFYLFYYNAIFRDRVLFK